MHHSDIQKHEVVQATETLSGCSQGRQLFSRLFPSYDDGRQGHVWVYRAVAVFALAFDIAMFYLGELTFSYRALIADLYFSALLFYAGGKGVRAEFVYVGTLVVVLVLGINTSVNMAGIGLYTICVSWINRRWFIPSVVALLGTELLQYPIMVRESGWTRSYFAVSSVLGLLIVLGLGFMLLHFNSQARGLRERVDEYREAAEAAGEKIRHEIASELHDSTARDLARLALTAQELSDRGGARAGELAQLAQLASDASRRIRPLILGIDSGRSSATVRSAIQQVISMLHGRDIELHVEVPNDIDNRVTRGQRLAGALVVREGATNILKYAPEEVTERGIPSIDEESGKVTLAGEEGTVEFSLMPAASGKTSEAGAVTVTDLDGQDVAVVSQVTENLEAQLIAVVDDESVNYVDFAIEVPAGYELQPYYGGFIFLNEFGELGGWIEPAWAVDADGALLPTSYEVLPGGIIRQNIDTTGATFPIVADPKSKWKWPNKCQVATGYAGLVYAGLWGAAYGPVGAAAATAGWFLIGVQC